MSYIDTFDHEHVGCFGPMYVYRSLETVVASDEDPADFGCDPSQLIIGGGSGEHPAIVVKSASEAAMFFVRAYTRFLPEQRELLRPILENWWNEASGVTRDPWSVFHFAGWRVHHYVRFAESCASPAFHRPFRSETDGNIERWLAESIGEFVLLAMPELVPDVLARLGDLRHAITHGDYQNILLIPPGYAAWGRREINDKVHWNISAWKVERQHHPLTSR